VDDTVVSRLDTLCMGARCSCSSEGRLCGPSNEVIGGKRDEGTGGPVGETRLAKVGDCDADLGDGATPSRGVGGPLSVRELDTGTDTESEEPDLIVACTNMDLEPSPPSLYVRVSTCSGL
jgi:hypothetical protein